MWYFRIPDTAEAEDRKGVYTVFNIHVNGYYHCSIRYSVLLEFYLEIKKIHDVSQLEPFPSKKIMKMSPLDLEERRIDLEKFLGSLSQDHNICRSALFEDFFLAAQHASSGIPMQTIQLEIYLVNDKKLALSVSNYSSSGEVLETMCQKLKMAPQLTYYFALFLEKKASESAEWTLARYLKCYESPGLSLEKANSICPHRIILRRNFWKADLAHQLLNDEVAVSLLYLETSEQLNDGELGVDPEELRGLAALKKKGLKKEFLEQAITTAHFGYRQLDSIEIFHETDSGSSPGVLGCVKVGSREMVAYVTEGGEAKPHKTMEITKIRCWKVGYDVPMGDPNKFFLSVNYHEGQSQFSWVKLRGEKAMLLTQFLDAAVQELVTLFNKQPWQVPSQQPFLQPRSFTAVRMRVGPSHVSPDVTTPTTASRDVAQSSSHPTTVPEAADTTKSAPAPSSEDGQPSGGATKVKVQKKKVGEVENAVFNTFTDEDL